MSLIDLTTPEGLQAFDSYIASKNYIQGYMPTSLDAEAFNSLAKAPAAQYTHALRFYNHLASFSDKQIAGFRKGAGMPAQLCSGGAAPAAAAPAKQQKAKQQQPKKEGKKKQDAPAAAPAAAANADPAEIARLEAAVKAQGDEVRKLKSEKVDKATLQPAIDKLIALKGELAAAGGAPADGGKKDKKSKKGKNKGGDKGGDKGGKKKDGKKEAKKDGEYDPKLIKAVVKEGGKKGQDILGVYEMGGLEFFCTTVDTPDGDIKLMNMVMDGMNQELDPTAEEKRGGAGEIGKMIFSAGVAQLGILARVPKDKVAKVNTKEWMQHVCTKIGAEMVGEATDEFASAVAKQDKDKGRFPIKMKDDAIAAGVEFLRMKGCFPEDNGDSSDDVCYGDDDFDEFM